MKTAEKGLRLAYLILRQAYPDITEDAVIDLVDLESLGMIVMLSQGIPVKNVETPPPGGDVKGTA